MTMDFIPLIAAVMQVFVRGISAGHGSPWHFGTSRDTLAGMTVRSGTSVSLVLLLAALWRIGRTNS